MTMLDSDTHHTQRATAGAVRVAPMRRFAMGGGREIVHCLQTCETKLMPTYLASLLAGCRDFRSMDEHLARMRQRLTSGSPMPESIRTTVIEACNAGWFVDEAAVRRLPEGASRPTTIAAVGIVTAGRVDTMRRCLESFIGHHKRAGRPLCFTVVDGSRDPAMRTTYRSCIETVAARSGAEVGYVGRDQIEAFVKALTHEGIDPQVASFALGDPLRCGFAVGASRNALLLNHCGEAFFQVDDDVVCAPTLPSQLGDALSFSTGHNPRSFEFFPDMHTALSHRQVVDGDLLALHEGMLGRNVVECIAATPVLEVGDGTSISDTMLSRALDGTGRIAVTQNGLVGDSGFGACSPFLYVTGALRDDLHGCDGRYRLATSSRIVGQTVPTRTISESAFCMAYALGMDNRLALPPFFPVRRNEDGVFGATLRSCYPEALFGHLPIQLVHQPPDVRTYPGGPSSAPPIEIGSILLQLIRSVQYGPVTDGSRRMRMLGQYLIDVSSVRPADFSAYLREQMWEGLRAQSMQLHNLLKTYDRSPTPWAADCDRHLEALDALAVREELGLPEDLREGRTPDECLSLTQRLVGEFGRLVVLWSDLVTAAKTLRARGITLAGYASR